MSADLHIHVYDGLTEDDLRAFFRNTLGSKWSQGLFGILSSRSPDMDAMLANHEKIEKQPNIWIGEVSWLKAALFEDGDERFVPDTVQVVNDAIGENLPVLDGELMEKILGAFSEANRTGYRIAKEEDVRKFLHEHMGKRLFTVSW